MKRNLLIPKRYKITRIINENNFIKTFYLKSCENGINSVKPGNFIMLWLPNSHNPKNSKFHSDEKPMSISDFDGNQTIAITVRNIGEFTDELHNYKKGMDVGITGPLGNNFEMKGKNILLIGGGTGIAPLRFFAKSVKNDNIKLYVIFGAKTKIEILNMDEIKEFCKEIIITSDDGTYGKKGFTTDYLEYMVKNHPIEQILCCGPEIMMKKVLDFCLKNKINGQFSLERYMYCGKGLCGFCSVDGLRVCRDGPVFDSQILSKIKDFGKKKRTKEGIMIDI